MKERLEFTSSLDRAEMLGVLAYLPVHLLFLPMALQGLLAQGKISELDLNFICYAAGCFYMLGLMTAFLRRDFDPLCDRPVYCAVEIIISLVMMYIANMALSLLLSQLVGLEENPNNAGMMELAGSGWRKTLVMAVIMAPILEECLFRAGIFGLLRRHSRLGAYVVAVTAFSLYHVWGYALMDPGYWIYALQYVPVSLLLCRLYELTNSIWCPIFFHGIVNYISLNALKAMEAML